MKNTEVERKFTLTDLDAVRATLAELGSDQIGTEHQIDTYYNHPGRDFLAGDVVSEWLRVRREHGTDNAAQIASLNFKRWLPLGAVESTHAEEYESTVGTPDTIAALLEALGFTEMVTVNKRRERWGLGEVEVAIDQVEGLGAFVEFEYKGDGDLDEAQAALTTPIKATEAHLGDRDRRGYPYLLLDREL
jgi:adenylate cyclase class 2